MLKKVLPLAILCFAGFVGCNGSQETVIPTDPLSAEQIEAIKAEDQSVYDEESAQQK